MKKTYIHPAMMAVKLQHQSIICVSQVGSTTTTGLDRNLNYDANGGDQSNAWTKESNGSVWDEEW